MTTLLDKATLEVAQFFGENDKPEDAARAVLKLVREEQMKRDLQAAFDRWLNDEAAHDTWNERAWHTMLRQWWSSQAAQVRSDE